MNKQRTKTAEYSCKLCRSKNIVLVKPGNIGSHMTADCFAVTDCRYGQTPAIFKCLHCNLLQCLQVNDPIGFYEVLEDVDYESGEKARSHQMKDILSQIRRFKPTGRLLDIGAASGNLVALALKAGYSAEGIEPSKSFCDMAQKKNLPVHLGTFPNTIVKGQFDIITLIDVLEHVAEPLSLLKEVSRALEDQGIGVLVTPDVSSVAAGLMGWKWWHYRTAHITYFSMQTLRSALDRAGLEPVCFKRPRWYFPLGYLIERLAVYLPQFMLSAFPKNIQDKIVPLNLFDSMLVIFRKKRSSGNTP